MIRLSANQEWVRETRYSVNTSARVPNELYNRLLQYQHETGLSKTDIINDALSVYLPRYDDQEGGREA